MNLDDNILTSNATASSLDALSNGRSGSGSASARAVALTELSEVQVKFVTRNKNLPQVPNTYLNVPVTLARYGLSEIVNALTETSPPRPFDFLINGQFLRGDLLKYLIRSGVGGESTLELEYVEALPEPQSSPSRPHPDWVASIDHVAGNGTNGLGASHLVTGCYDSVVRVYEAGLDQKEQPAIALGVGHTSAIKAVAVFKNDQVDNKNVQIVSGSKDRAVRVWKFTPGSSQLRSVALCTAHTDSVECVAVAEGADTFCSGGWDSSIAVWDLTNADTVLPAAEEAHTSKKRKTTASFPSSSLPNHMPLRLLSGHTGAVTSLVYPHPSSLYSGSMDHSIRQWDVETGAQRNAWFGTKVITSIDFSVPASNLLVSGHHDKIVRVWDARKGEKEACKLQLKSHKGFVAAVKFSPTNPHQLASAGYDNTVKLWDLRAALPLFTIQAHADKVLALDWLDGDHLVSGGADKQLQTHAVNKAAKAESL